MNHGYFVINRINFPHLILSSINLFVYFCICMYIHSSQLMCIQMKNLAFLVSRLVQLQLSWYVGEQ